MLIRALRSLRRSRSGTSIIEFALVLPLLVIILLGQAELGRYMRYRRHVLAYAKDWAQIYSMQQSVDVSYITGMANVLGELWPELAQDALNQGLNYWALLGINATSIAMTPTVAGCTSGCSYKANVVWDIIAGGQGAQLARTCGQNFTSNPGPITKTNLPPQMYVPTSYVVVDMIFTYVPMFGQSFLPTIPITVHAVSTPRYASPYLSYPTGDWTSWTGGQCPGF